MNRNLFNKALGGIKKDVKKYQEPTTGKKNEQKDNSQSDIGDISSEEEKRLIQLGAIKKHKKISKNERESDTWKHDKFQHKNSNAPHSQQSWGLKSKSKWLIKFKEAQKYSQIFDMVRNDKAFIEQIDDRHILFRQRDCYQKAKKVIQSNGIELEDQENDCEVPQKKQKRDIMERFQ